MSISTAFVKLSIIISLGAAECPGNHEEIPTLYDDDTFTCWVFWSGLGHDSPLNSCIDCDGVSWPEAEEWLYPDGSDKTTEPEMYFHVGSFLVKPGCTVTGFVEANYEGEFRDFYGTLLESNNQWGHNFLDSTSPTCGRWGWGSQKCRCQQKMPDCVPVDGWDAVLVCNNVDGSTVLDCDYQQSIGTVWSSSTSESFEIDTTIEETISAGFFGLFETELGLSQTTSYDWAQTSEQTMQNVVTITVGTTVNPGEQLVLEQAIGQCGDDVPRTEMFKATTTNKAGEVVSVKYEQRGRTVGQSPRAKLEAAKRGLRGHLRTGNLTLPANSDKKDYL